MPLKTDGTEGVFPDGIVDELKAHGPKTVEQLCEWAVMTYAFCSSPGMGQLVPVDFDQPDGPKVTALRAYIELYLWLLSRDKRVLKLDHERWAYQEPMYNI